MSEPTSEQRPKTTNPTGGTTNSTGEENMSTLSKSSTMGLPSNTRDPCHWALWLEKSDGQSVILQVGDDKNGRGYYVEDPIYKEPMRSTKLAKVINCATFLSNKYELAVIIIQDHPVNNESTTWNCQDWVVENSDNLEEGGLL